MWDDGIIWEGVAGGELLLRACSHCHAICHPPLPMCPHCQTLAWDMRPASGRAVLKAWLISAHPHHQPNADHRIVVVVQLEEGVNFVSNLIGLCINELAVSELAVTELYEGMPLELCFDTVDGVTLPLFRPISQAGSDA